MYSEWWTQSSYNEAKTIIDSDHPNIVEIYVVCKSPRYIYIIMELVNGGSLESSLEELENRGENLDEMSAYDLIRQTTAGLKYLHSQNILHGDFHSGNILLSFEGNRCLCKIADFGRSEVKTEYNVDIDYRFLTTLTNVVYSFAFTRPPAPPPEKNSEGIGKNGHIFNEIQA